MASNREGICDTVIDGITGYLVAEKNIKEFTGRILGVDLERRGIQTTVRSKFDWSSIAGPYRELIIHPLALTG